MPVSATAPPLEAHQGAERDRMGQIGRAERGEACDGAGYHHATATPEAPAVEEGAPESPETLTAIEAPIAEPSLQALLIEAPPMIEEAAPIVDDSARWNALAEDIRMQVLQRIDIFTDTGLKDQLNQRLQPIVDRASADLVAAINQHVGQLLRAYVAEAIEREIEKWRENARTTLPPA